MTPEAFHEAALGLTGATMDVQWGDDRVYKVGGKMFAATNGAATNLSLKATDIAFEALTGTARARPAPYLAKAKWVMFDDLAVLEDAEVADWLKTSHELVAAKLTRKQRAEIGLT